MNRKYEQVGESRSLRSLIAWLSVCLMVAAWGPQLDPTLRKIWASIGSFGLASAFALDLAMRLHRGVKKHVQKKATERRVERAVAGIVTQGKTLGEIYAALNRITHDARSRGRLANGHQSAQCEPFQCVAHLTPLANAGAPDDVEIGDAQPVDLRHISVHGVGFFHCQPIKSKMIDLTFYLLDNEKISVIAKLQWQRQLPDGTYSGGARLITVKTSSSTFIAPVSAGVG